MKINNVKLQNFIELPKEKHLEILQWRNSDNIRKWMYTKNIISTEEHFSFIEMLKENYSKQYFLVSKDDQDIGVIYFTNIDKHSSYFGLYSNPNTKIPGVGRILEATSIDYAFDILKVDKLKLEVYSKNKQVINLHKKFHFKEVDIKYVNNEEVVCMELENDNR